MWRSLGIVCLFAAVASAWLVTSDRRSLLALQLVEWESVLRVPVYVALGVTGGVLVFLSPRKTRFRATQRPRRPPMSQPKRQRESGQRHHQSSDGWLADLQASAERIEFEAGVRITIDTSQAFPLTMTLEHMPTERSRRAVTSLGIWLSTRPYPPRLKVIFSDCPASAGFRHHQVAGALGVSISRADFHVVSHSDEVEVVFHQPGVMWPPVPVARGF